MPQYFFDIRLRSGSLCPDRDGTELPDADAAKRMARQIAAEIVRDLPARTSRNIAIDVSDEHRQQLFVVGSDDLERA